MRTRAGSARWGLAAVAALLLAAGAAAWWLAGPRGGSAAGAQAVAARLEQLFEAGDHAGVLELASAHAERAAHPALHHWAGYAHFQLNDPGAAVAELERALQLAPDQVPTLQLLGRAHMTLDRHDRAVAPLERAAALGGGAYVRLLLGQALLGAGRPAEAAGHLRAAAAEHPVEASYALGRLARDQGDLAAAAAAFRRTLALDRTHLAATYALGQVLVRTGRREEGAEMLARHAELAKWHDAHEFAARNARSPGANFVNFLELAEVELRQERWEQAAAAYQRALTDRPSLIEASNGLARILLRLGRRGPATQAVQHSLQIDPRHPEACHLAAVLAALRDDREAETRHVALSRRSGPWSADQHARYGEALLRCGRVDEARGELETALRRDRDHVEARVLLGRAALAERDADGAAALAAEGLARRLRSAELRWIQALAAVQSGRRGEAREAFAAAVRLDAEALVGEDELERRVASYRDLPGAPEGIALYRAVRAEDASTR